ncbi:MAG TPA: NAD(P)H-binding protein [Solirubrobacterales bacterium]|nr:NAD(P)H-binding protein [Solirubrobacterales bacterium]
MATEKKIAVAGATGRLGRPTVEILRERGHEVVPISRSEGVDVITGEGLGAALEGVDLIVDAATGPSPDQAEATEFFTTAARNLQEAGAASGVEEILVVSIIGTDHFNTGYNAAKVAQEQAHFNGPLPARVLRAAQFHEFVAELVEWGTEGDTARLPQMRTQLVAAEVVAEALADLVDGADSAPIGNPIAEVAGPREENLLEAAKLLAAQRGDDLRIEAGDFFDDPEGLYPAGAVLPGPIAKLAGPTYEEWLNQK